jgi:protein-arginine kinase activator protein McsA
LACYEKLFLTVEAEEADTNALSVCPYCGCKVDELKKTALVGCANCYKTLQGAVIPTVIRMQQGGKDGHRGKVSENVRKKSRAERRYEELLALKEYYEETGDIKLAARYEKSAEALRLEIIRGNYDGA